MTSFIQLEDTSREANIMVNPEYIVSIAPTDDPDEGALVTLISGEIEVKETMREIIKRIADALR